MSARLAARRALDLERAEPSLGGSVLYALAAGELATARELLPSSEPARKPEISARLFAKLAGVDFHRELFPDLVSRCPERLDRWPRFRAPRFGSPLVTSPEEIGRWLGRLGSLDNAPRVPRVARRAAEAA